MESAVFEEPAQAARSQMARSSRASASLQCPTITFRSRRILAPMKQNSRSPCADWLRFMKSMSMSAHGISRLYWVWRCTKGFSRLASPAIHIFAGEKVCIHVMSPTQPGAAFASLHSSRIPSGVVTTGLKTIFTGVDSASERARAISRECSPAASRVSRP